jgi:hypothetical protein
MRTVSTLLRLGADLNDYVPLEEGRFKATPIWYAVAHGDNLPLVKMLLKRGARADNCLYAVVWNDNAHVMARFQRAKSSWSSSGTPSRWHMTSIG